MKILAIDIGGTALKYVVIKNGKFQFPFQTKATYKINARQLVTMIGAIFQKFNDLAGIAIASPGAIEKGRYVNFWTAIEGLSQGFDFTRALQKQGVNVPISIINDGNAAAFGEHKIGAGKNYATMAYIGIGSGIGCGAIYQNVMLEGHQGYGSEFGSAFELWNQATNQYESPQDHGGFHGIMRKWKLATGDSITGKEVFAKYDDKHPLAVKIVKELYQAIAKTLFNIVMTINPELIILGGGLAHRKQALSEIKQAFAKVAGPKSIPLKVLNLQRTEVYHKAALYGAYYHHLKVSGDAKN